MVKQKKCKNPDCGKLFTPARPLQVVCGFHCSLIFAKIKSHKKQKKHEKERRAEIREAKIKAKTRGKWLAEAQAAFNAYIRSRDAGKPCISCGRHHTGSWDAGHYRARSVAPALRFNENNCHAQCVPCNRHRHGNLIEYRKGLIARIGIELVEFLEGDHPPVKYTIDQLRIIKADYSIKTKNIKK